MQFSQVYRAQEHKDYKAHVGNGICNVNCIRHITPHSCRNGPVPRIAHQQLGGPAVTWHFAAKSGRIHGHQGQQHKTAITPL